MLKLVEGSHYEAKPSPQQRTLLRLWIETGAPYADTYTVLGTGMIGAYREDILDRSDTNWPALKAAQAVLERRCQPFHTGPIFLGKSERTNNRAHMAFRRSGVRLSSAPPFQHVLRY